jgi:hypothetical protein
LNPVTMIEIARHPLGVFAELDDGRTHRLASTSAMWSVFNPLPCRSNSP